jgi:hypothetical protein
MVAILKGLGPEKDLALASAREGAPQAQTRNCQKSNKYLIMGLDTKTY